MSADTFESGIPFAKKQIIMDAGHLVPYEQPEKFNNEVLNFLTGAEFYKILNTDGVAAAVNMFTTKRQNDDTWIPFDETEMNTLGYQYLRTRKVTEAIARFKLNVLAYPESANTYDSLGEAYIASGNNELAIENYKKSLELDPENKNAAEVLERLKK